MATLPMGMGITNCFLVKLRHMTGKCFFIQNRMVCSILFSIVNKEMGKKVHFHHNKDHFCSCFFILTTNLAKNEYFSENKKPLYSHFSGETKSFTQKMWKKKVLQEDGVCMTSEKVRYLLSLAWGNIQYLQTIDNSFLPLPSLELTLKGMFPKLPIIIGWTNDDTTLFTNTSDNQDSPRDTRFCTSLLARFE